MNPEKNIFGGEMNSLNEFIGNQGQLTEAATRFTDSLMNKAKNMLVSMVGYKELMMRYACALKEIKTKFEVLNTEFNVRFNRNPISSIQSRIKSNTSTMEKMMRKGLPFRLDIIENSINDIAGIRIICDYIDDIYRLADALISQDDITLLQAKDYIKNPKDNGYRSYHMIVSVPVFFADGKKNMKVEVQIRTIAMDFWASLEHQMKYKQEIPEQSEMIKRLKESADVISKIDNDMLSIRREIEDMADKPSEDEELLEKLRRLNEPIV